VLSAYFAAFGLTLAVEVPIYVTVLVVAVGVGWARAVLVAVAVNVVTHPLVWWTLHSLTGRSAYPEIFIGVEISVCVVEWALLLAWVRRPERGRTDIALLALASVAANAASTLAGLLLIG
jgi:hypothetical protein